MPRAVVYLALSAVALASVASYIGVAVMHVHREERLSLGGIIASFTALPVLGMVLKSFSAILILAILACVPLGLVAGTFGHPERLWARWIDSVQIPKLSIWAQLRVVAFLLLFGLLALVIAGAAGGLPDFSG